MSTTQFNEDGLLSVHSVVPDQHQEHFLREGGWGRKRQGHADNIKASDQLVVSVAAKPLVKPHAQSCALFLDIISWYLICPLAGTTSSFVHF